MIKKSETKKKKKRKTAVVKTLRGAEAWNKPKRKKTTRKKSKRLGGTGAGFVSELMKVVVENSKPVAGGIASDMVINTVTKQAPQVTPVANAITFLVGSALEVALPKKMSTAKDIIKGATICSGKDALGELLEGFGVTSLSGFQELAGYQQLSGFQELSGTPIERSVYPVNVAPIVNSYIQDTDVSDVDEIFSEL